MHNPHLSALSPLSLEGGHYQMGYQHGCQVRPLRPHIVSAIEVRLRQIEQDQPGETFEELVAETRRFLQAGDPPTYDFIRGQADSLELEFDWLLRYNLVNFLRDALTTRFRPTAAPANDKGPQDGCTAWAASGPATADGQPVLVKNRDYRLEHLPLQVVVRARPAAGYRYIYVTSAGNPGVFVAGLNEAGLAVADTHVACPDVGPGLPTYALSMHLLEEQRTVPAALAYLQAVPRLGRNNLILADADGHLAIFENAHTNFAVLESTAGFLVSTNHFNSPTMRDCFTDTDPEPVRGNTFQRYQKVQEVLSAAYGRLDLPLIRQLMTTHAGRLASICRHPQPGAGSSTISTIILLPVQRRLLYAHGQPCQSSYRPFECVE